MTYDDERVVALLKESVPAVPDAPARVDAVRRLAARQRSFVPVQALGAAASVVLVLAAVAAVARPGTGELRPVRDPVATMAGAIQRQPSGRFEMTTRVDALPGGEPLVVVTTGAFTRDGDLRVDAPQDGELGMGEIRVVDGVMYRAGLPGELPPGKRYVRMKQQTSARGAVLTDVRTLHEHLRDVRYVRRATVRGTDVAEYEGTAAPEAFRGASPTAVLLTFALDAEGLPRRIAATLDVGGTRMSMTIEYFAYGDPVVVTAPPASEVADESELGLAERRAHAARSELRTCAIKAATGPEVGACLDAYATTVGNGVTCSYTFASREAFSYTCSDRTSATFGGS